MTAHIKKRFILFLRGTYINSCDKYQLSDNDDEYDDLKLNEDELIDYNKIPAKYIKSTWPRFTNLKCWYCDLTFNTPPYFIPMGMVRDMSEISMPVLGNFCSPHCAIKEAGKLNLLEWQIHQLLCIVHKDITNKDLEIPIIESPDKTRMSYYGGDWTSEDYRKAVQNITKSNTTYSISDILVSE